MYNVFLPQVDSIQAEKNRKRIFKIEIQNYFYSLVGYFYISAQYVIKQSSNAFAYFDR